MNPPLAAIEVRELHKTFRIPTERVHRLKERVLHPLRGTRYNELHVLDDVSFDVATGEFFGIVGVNGSGKSTLLKLLASIYRADRGRIRVAGRVTPFIELGVGFNPELTAYDNVMLNGVMMGLTVREARRSFDEVMDYAGLQEFGELQLKNYSSGMQVRLAFAVMLQVESEILLIDEVLAVGDAAFQEKCIESLMRLHSEGRTIVFVTHAMPLVERFCDRAMLLHRGSVNRIGEPVGVTRGYMDAGHSAGGTVWGKHESASRPTSQLPAEITEFRVEDASGRERGTVDSTETVTVRLEIALRAVLERAWLHLEIHDRHGTLVFGTGSPWIEDGGALEAGDNLAVSARLEARLVPGPYVLSCSLRADSHDGAVTQPASNTRTTPLTVSGRVWGVEGIVSLPHEFEIERARSEAVAK